MRAIYISIATVLLGLTFGVVSWAQAPITGTVVQLWWAKDDLFVQLDTNNDTRADVLVEIEQKTQIVDVNNNPLPISAIVVGVTLTVTHYKWDDDGYYEAYRVVVGTASTGQPPATSAQQPIKGVVLQTLKFGDDFFVALDTNGDNQPDARVKIKSRAIITDPAGNRLSFDAIKPGVTITLVAYKLDDEGYYEAWHVIVGETSTPVLQPLVGIVLEVLSFGDDLFVRLDANGDGKEDFPVKISKSTTIVDPQGKSLDRSSIVKGVRLTITQYELKNGYYEAKHVIVG
uniref:Uncharacterized protein n=1 Tax=Acetithermum autotrophicum TaxID=1446466 RepID=H5SQL9_ACEAU|nr:hypothetical protein HGMM_OP2C329 [Candidatus Acetothermum autotrophicum]